MPRYQEGGYGREPKSVDEKYMTSVPKILYGIMKELQRLNALKALELKFKVDESYEATPADVDQIMNSDPAGKYGREDREDRG